MSSRRVAWQCALIALLLVSLALPSLDTVAGWNVTSYAGWPGVGLSAAVFVLAGPQGRWAALAVQSVLVGLVLGWTYHVAWWAGAAASLAITLPSMLSAHWLRPHLAPYRRFNEDEVDAYHGVTALAGLVCGVLSGAAAAAAGRGDLAHVLLTGFIAFAGATTSQLLVLPFLLRTAGGWRRLGSSPELWGQRVMLVVSTVSIFAWHSALPLAFILFPVLGWAAIRATAPETHVQVLFVSMAAFAGTAVGRGPLALGSLEHPNRFAPLLVHAFIASVLYLLVPLALTVERLTSVTRQATSSARTVSRMLDSATGTVFIATDPAGLITHYNPGAEQALGYSAEDVMGRSSIMLHTEEEVRQQASHFGLAAASPWRLYAGVVAAQVAGGVRRDWEFRRKDGARRTVSLNISTMTEPNGSVTGYIVSGEDITERVQAQAALQKAFQREHESAQALQKALQRERESAQVLRDTDAVKQELVSTVSHELRTPITNIAGYAEVLIDGDLGELSNQQHDAVDRIERNTSRLREMVDDLLTLSRTESGALRTTMTPVDLNDVARSARELLARQVAGRELTIQVDLAETPVLVRGDKRLLDRAVTNLWSNAIKFTPDGGTIRMGVLPPTPAGPTANAAAIVISDSGMGIAPDEQAQVFTRFYRTSAAGERAIQGSGLGLSIVKAIVEQHDGDIALVSSPGRGTTFTVSLPPADQPGDALPRSA